MTGAVTGRLATAVGGAVAGSRLGSSYGTIGAVIGGVAGLAAGGYLESKLPIGRIAGGMIGGVAGSVVGLGADLVGLKPSETLARECKGFSLTKLPGRLANTKYTSHARLSKEVAAEGTKHLMPGDFIMTNDDADFQLELLQRATGGNAHWTHNYMVDNDGTVMDILIGNDGPTRWPLEHAFTDNSHAQILRPHYQSPETLEKTLEAARRGFGTITYDSKFDLRTDDAQYCQEYAYKAIKEGDPSVRITPRKVLGRELVSAEEFQNSPDFTEVWSTGSNFWLNWLSHFN